MPLPLGISGLETKDGRVILHWNKPSGDTRGYYILRSTDGTPDFRQLGSPFISGDPDVTFVDSLINVTGADIMYQVKAENTSYSISPPTEPVHVNPGIAVIPSAPLNLTARYMDGHVLLTWDVPTDPPGTVLGYFIYRKMMKKNGSDSTDFTRIDKETLPVLSNYMEDRDVKEGCAYEYAVQARGMNQVFSPQSMPTHAAVPSFRPVSISSLHVVRTEQGITLDWEKTKQEGISGYRIYRVEADHAASMIASLSPDKTTYTDNAVNDDGHYFYAITCVSDSNIESRTEDWTSCEDFRK